MNEYDFNQLKRAAIAEFKEYYSQFDARIKRVGEWRFTVMISVSGDKVIVKLHNFYGKKYSQVYYIKDLL